MDFKNYDEYWCYHFIKKLSQLGVNNFFIASGSRSSLIIWAIIKNKCNIFTAIDERSLGFMALGWAKKQKFPAAIVVTSGTAVANLYPSIWEAYNSKIPLLIITADRPYELLDCAANQTIKQANIFSACVVKSYDLAPPNEQTSINLSINTALLAFMQANEYQKGPVHINIQIREELNHQLSCKTNLITKDLSLEKISSKCLIVVGEMPLSNTQLLICQLADKYNWPIYADILSNIRLLNNKLIIHNFELCLLNENFKSLFVDYTILYFGTRLVSKRFWQWLSKESKEVFYFNNTLTNSDQLGIFNQVIATDLDQYLQKEINKENYYQNNWGKIKELSNDISLLTQNFLQQNITEASFAVSLLDCIKQEVLIFVSASMPIRYLDQMLTYAPCNIEVLSNRGVSGIDGVMSSAIGAALSCTKRTILLIGDMAFIHDSNSLALLKQLKTPMLILVINNQGGGIFNFLPINNDKEILPFITLAHETNLQSLCHAYEINYQKISHPKELVINTEKYFSSNMHTVVEIVSNSDRNSCLIKELYKNIKEAYEK